jgi:hypothetical protein
MVLIPKSGTLTEKAGALPAAIERDERRTAREVDASIPGARNGDYRRIGIVLLSQRVSLLSVGC